MKPRLLDLFCGAGGCTKGYQRAGFYVVGVDNRPQPNYCGDEFVQDDALALMSTFPWWDVEPFDAIHASPPCQAFSVATKAWNGKIKRAEHADLIEPTRDLLERSGLPWVIENVVGAPLRNPTLICGTMFDPPMAVQRHRLFETNWPLTPPQWPCRHDLWEPQFPPTRSDRTRPAGTVSVFGAGGGRAKNYELWKWAMDVDWMSKHELAQAIPPAYTELIGHQLLQHVRARAAALIGPAAGDGQPGETP